MPVQMTDIEPTVTTHTHHCPFHGGDFDCTVFFCEGIPNLMCDGCYSEPGTIETLLVNYDKLAGYIQEKEAERV